jgi:type 1 glutamine amidotransferase
MIGDLRWSAWAALAAALSACVPLAGRQATARPPRKHVLAWADVRNGYQHDSVSHAVATIERLGRESGAYDTFIRTDSQLITKHPIMFAAGTGIATGETFNVRNLDYFDAIFFFGVREIELSAEQRSDLLSFVKDDGKGFVAAHAASTAFFSWPEFGEMLGGRFDEHPWGIADGTVIVDEPAFPAMRHLRPAQVFHDELYQIKNFSRHQIRVLAHLDASKLNLTKPLVHRTDGDFPAAWARTYGKGRVFYSILGHDADDWDNPAIATMYYEAVRWALGLVDGDASPSAPGRYGRSSESRGSGGSRTSLEVRRGPAQAVAGLARRHVFTPDPTRVAEAIDVVQQRAEVDRTRSRLVPSRHVGELQVPDARQQPFDRRGDVPLHDLHVVDVVLQLQVVRSDRVDDLDCLRGPAQEESRKITGVDRLDEQPDAGRLQARCGIPEILHQRVAGRGGVDVRWQDAGEAVQTVAFQRGRVCDRLIDAGLELVHAIPEAGDAALASRPVPGR